MTMTNTGQHFTPIISRASPGSFNDKSEHELVPLRHYLGGSIPLLARRLVVPHPRKYKRLSTRHRGRHDRRDTIPVYGYITTIGLSSGQQRRCETRAGHNAGQGNSVRSASALAVVETSPLRFVALPTNEPCCIPQQTDPDDSLCPVWSSYLNRHTPTCHSPASTRLVRTSRCQVV